MKDITHDPFEEYLRSREPGKREKGYAWQTAIGLQKADGLETSEYLRKTAYQHIEGKISIDEAKHLIESYYKQPRKKPENISENRIEEADIVSARIAEILSENSFTFGVTTYISIHKRLFTGLYSHAGKIRDYDISKSEWVLNGESVMYGGASELRATLEYDIQTESQYRYDDLSMSEIIKHIARFISRLWQIHVFGEGNTRTTAVFLIKYLRKLGFDVNNDTFANNSWYFRNAMVRANYSDLTNGIHETTEYLVLFLRNLLLGEHHDLKNRYLHVCWDESREQIEIRKQDIESEKQDIGVEKQDIGGEKQDIEFEKQDIEVEKQDIQEDAYCTEERFPYELILEENNIKGKTGKNMLNLYRAFQLEHIFSRQDVMDVLKITSSPASVLIKKMKVCGIIEPVKGIGKGRYRFKP